MKLWSSPWLYCLKELQIINRGKQVTSLRRRFKSHLSLVHIFSCPSVFGSCNTVFVLACNRDRPLPPHLMATLLAPSVLPASKPDHRATRPPPKGTSSLRMFLWRQRIWFESTFVLSMLEPWEKVLLCEFQRPEFRKTSVTFTSVSMLALFFFLVILACSSIFLTISMWCIAAQCITYSVRKATQDSGLSSVKGLEMASETYWKSCDCGVRQPKLNFRGRHYYFCESSVRKLSQWTLI